jgi:DNA mismatch endonuclease (patch repair protein)
MKRVRQRGTTPELAVRRAFRALGLAFRLNDPGLPGSPDLVNRSRRIAVFVHGCYWHRHRGCVRTTTPTANRGFWQAKFDANVARDRRKVAALRALGYAVLVVWECDTRDASSLVRRVQSFIARSTLSSRTGSASRQRKG